MSGTELKHASQILDDMGQSQRIETSNEIDKHNMIKVEMHSLIW